MSDLWSDNHPRRFWHCSPSQPDELWDAAIQKAMPLLGLPDQTGVESALVFALGEGRFGPDHWRLSPSKRAYYLVKSLIPRPVTRGLRRIYNRGIRTDGVWPIDRRYVDFLWEVLRQVLVLGDLDQLSLRNLWPERHGFALVLTHDIETAMGQDYVEAVADLEESLGFRSSFNFVPERYRVNRRLMDDLRQRGFEVGVHGLRHDGKLFDSKSRFMQKADRINAYLKEWNATGFRAELTHRQPEWMQALEIEYDLSFFDTDPFEPIPGGSMSIWPYFVGHFVELPYTLVQDYTLTSILGKDSAGVWLEKVDFVEKYHGMALLNAHPDYLRQDANRRVYQEFLCAMKESDRCWRALPHQVASWWNARCSAVSEADLPGLSSGVARLRAGAVEVVL